MENARVEGGEAGIRIREGVEDDLATEMTEELSSPLDEGLFDEAGNSVRDVAACPGDKVVYPSHIRPEAVHLAHAGRASSHLTRLDLFMCQTPYSCRYVEGGRTGKSCSHCAWVWR